LDLVFYDHRIDQLVRHFAKLSDRLGRFVAGVDFASGAGDGVHRSLVLVGELEGKLRSWADREIPAIYRREGRETGALLKRLGRARRVEKRSHDRDLRTLIREPGFGLVPRLLHATGSTRDLLRRIDGQLKALRRSKDLLRATQARLAAVSPPNAESAVLTLAREITELTALSDRVFPQATLGLPADHVFSNLAALGTVRSGGRNLRTESYAKLILRSVVSHTIAVSRRNRLLESNQALVQIKPQRGERPTLCHLYIGRVFALTQKAAESFDVPHVLELPSGGVPFHPGCRHEEIPWVPKSRGRGRRGVYSRPPDWALNTSYESARIEFKKAGGDRFAAEQNPLFEKAPIRSAPGGELQRWLADG